MSSKMTDAGAMRLANAIMSSKIAPATTDRAGLRIAWLQDWRTTGWMVNLDACNIADDGRATVASVWPHERSGSGHAVAELRAKTIAALPEFVAAARELIFGDGTSVSQQRVIDLARLALTKAGMLP